MIIKQLFINFTVLVALLFFYTQVFKKQPLSHKSSVKVKIIAGLLGGILSNILMQFSFTIDTVILDMRQIPVIILAYFGGALPAIISVILIALGRFYISIDKVAYLSTVISISGALFAWFFSKVKYKMPIKIFYIITFNNLILSIFYIYINYDVYLRTEILTVYWIISYLSAYLSFYILCYIRHTQMLFRKYEQDSVTDELTGLHNFRKFDEVFNERVDRAKTNGQKLSLLYIDIDYFKQINDMYGHVDGDLVLKELGSILRKSTRNGDIVCRIGGEEFSVLLIDCSLNESLEVAEKIRKSVKNNAFQLHSEKRIHLTVSIGAASYPETTKQPKELIPDADQALYRAKNSGRNKVCVAYQAK